jgi:prepilin-type N-terminal cleavage/methylation domain-containing protein
MKNNQRSLGRNRRGTQAGFSLIEVVVSVGIMTVIMGSTIGALNQAMKANETALLVTSMNNSLRTGMDVMIRDMLQVGSGLPVGHAVLIPSGTGSARINIPGPPGTSITGVATDVDLNAVNPGPGLGPVLNGVATDIVTTLAADSTFSHVLLTARSLDGTTIDVDPATPIGSGPDKVMPGQLIMLEKGTMSILLEVTDVNAAARRITFATTDSLKLNQHTAPAGSVAGVSGLNNLAPSPDIVPDPGPPAATFLHTTATRVRMITYYIDATDAAHPKLVRRINNGNATTFSNLSGSTVAFDIDNLKISYDIADSVNNPANVRFVAADYAAGGACGTISCSVNQVRKINITLGGRSRSVFSATRQYFHNVLSTQVSLRGMSFVNEYSPPAVP